ncbi:MAG: ion channel [Actinomycetota bacterium]
MSTLRSAHRRDARESAGRGSSGPIAYTIVLALLVVTYGLCAAQATTDPSPLAFLAMLATVGVVFRVTAAPALVQHLVWVVIAVAGAAAIVVMLLGLSGTLLDIALSTASLVALLVAPLAIIAHQVTRRRLNVEALLAATAAYVLLGMFFTFAFNLFSLLVPGPLFAGDTVDSLASQLFFSFTTLTTTGYGNIVPIHPGAQAIAVAEAIAGQLFLITAVARILRGVVSRTDGPSASAPLPQEAP